MNGKISSDRNGVLIFSSLFPAVDLLKSYQLDSSPEHYEREVSRDKSKKVSFRMNSQASLKEPGACAVVNNERDVMAWGLFVMVIWSPTAGLSSFRYLI